MLVMTRMTKEEHDLMLVMVAVETYYFKEEEEIELQARYEYTEVIDKLIFVSTYHSDDI